MTPIGSEIGFFYLKDLENGLKDAEEKKIIFTEVTFLEDILKMMILSNGCALQFCWESRYFYILA